MRCIVVGYGVQGKKRLAVAASEAAGVVDPIWTGAQWKDVREVPVDLYDAAVVCTPDAPKMGILRHLVRHGKHALTEKPLHAGSDSELAALEQGAGDTGALLVTAYNHRFEPHYVGMRDLIASGELGKIYRCRMFYGNGTARLVRESAWRDQGATRPGDAGAAGLRPRRSTRVRPRARAASSE